MGRLKKIEKILEEAIEGETKMSLSVSLNDDFNSHMILNADEIEIINGNLLQISTDYTECSLNLNNASINTYKELDNEIVNIVFDNLVVSLGVL